MNRSLLITFVGLLGLFVFQIRPLRADVQPPDVDFALYSWPRRSRWEFAVYEGSGTVRPLQEMRSPAHRMNLDKLKGRIASLPNGGKLYWRVDQQRGLVLPPKELIQDLDRYARTAGVLLLLPGQTKQDKDIQGMQSDMDTLRN